MEAPELPAVGVSLDLDVHRREARRALVIVGRKRLGQEDHARAGAQSWHAVLYALAQGLEHTKLGKQLALRG